MLARPYPRPPVPCISVCPFSTPQLSSLSTSNVTSAMSVVLLLQHEVVVDAVNRSLTDWEEMVADSSAMPASICRLRWATTRTASGTQPDHIAADMFDSRTSTICRCSADSNCGDGTLPLTLLGPRVAVELRGNTVSSRRSASSRVRRFSITGNSTQHKMS